MVEDRLKQNAWRDYMANNLYLAAGSVYTMGGGKDYPMPVWTEVVNPKPKETRTGQQIIDDLAAKLLRGVKNIDAVQPVSDTDAG